MIKYWQKTLIVHIFFSHTDIRWVSPQHHTHVRHLKHEISKTTNLPRLSPWARSFTLNCTNAVNLIYCTHCISARVNVFGSGDNIIFALYSTSIWRVRSLPAAARIYGSVTALLRRFYCCHKGSVIQGFASVCTVILTQWLFDSSCYQKLKRL